jgi:hypothetical protein
LYYPQGSNKAAMCVAGRCDQVERRGGWAVDWAPSAKVASWTCYPPMQESDVRLLRGARPADQAMWQTDRRNLVRRGSRARVIHELRLIARAPSRSERQVPILESIRQKARVRLWPGPVQPLHPTVAHASSSCRLGGYDGSLRARMPHSSVANGVDDVRLLTAAEVGLQSSAALARLYAHAVCRVLHVVRCMLCV